MHIPPPVTAEGFDGSHHPRFAEWSWPITSSSSKENFDIVWYLTQLANYWWCIELFLKQQILDSTKLKVCRRQFQIWLNSRNFSKWVENTVGKGKLAPNRQFPPFSTMFLKDLYYRHVKTRGCLGKGQPILKQWYLLTTMGNKPFENTVGKGEIAGNEQFLLFPQCFLPI